MQLTGSSAGCPPVLLRRSVAEVIQPPKSISGNCRAIPYSNVESCALFIVFTRLIWITAWRSLYRKAAGSTCAWHVPAKRCILVVGWDRKASLLPQCRVEVSRGRYRCCRKGPFHPTISLSPLHGESAFGCEA